MKLFALFSLFFLTTFLGWASSELDLPPSFEVADVLNPAPDPLNNPTKPKVLEPQVKVRGKASSSPARIIAIVNEDVITLADLEERLRLTMGERLPKIPAEELTQIKQMLLKQMIDEILQLQAATRVGITVDQPEIENEIKNIETQNNMPAGKLLTDLKRKRVSEKALFQNIKARLAWGKYIYAIYRDAVQVGKSDLSDYIGNELVPQYHLGEIVIYMDSPDEDEKAQQQIGQIIEQLKKGESFAQLAQQFSQSPSAARGGDIGWIREDQMEEEVGPAIENLTAGHVSNPIKTDDGYKLLFVRDRKFVQGIEEDVLTARQLEIKLDPELLKDEKALNEEIKRLNDLVKSAKECVYFEQLVDQIENSDIHIYKNVRLEDLSPDLQRVFKDMNINEPSEGILNNGSLIFFTICERAKMKAESVSKESVSDKIMSQRFEAIAQQKLRDLRRVSSIDIRL